MVDNFTCVVHMYQGIIDMISIIPYMYQGKYTIPWHVQGIIISRNHRYIIVFLILCYKNIIPWYVPKPYKKVAQLMAPI